MLRAAASWCASTARSLFACLLPCVCVVFRDLTINSTPPGECAASLLIAPTHPHDSTLLTPEIFTLMNTYLDMHMMGACAVGASMRPVFPLTRSGVCLSHVPGFGRFFDEGDESKQAKKGDDKDGAGSGKEGGSGGGGGGGGGDGSGGGKNGKKGPSGSPEDSNQTQQMLSLLLASGALMWLLSMRSSSTQGKELNWQQFRNEYLAPGKVQSLEVVNNDIVRVIPKTGSG